MKKFVIKFPRGKDGMVDLDGGEYSDKPASFLNVKYEKEVRLCVGSAIRLAKEEDDADAVVEYNGSKLVGEVLKPFDYSSKVILSIKDYNQRLEKEIQRVKSLSNHTAWITSHREIDTLYNDDELERISGVGDTTAAKLGKIGITTVGELKEKLGEPNGLHSLSLASNVQQFVLSKCQQEIGKHFTEHNKPGITDHVLADNPYKSKYGDEWEKKLLPAPQCLLVFVSPI